MRNVYTVKQVNAYIKNMFTDVYKRQVFSLYSPLPANTVFPPHVCLHLRPAPTQLQIFKS